MPSQHDFTQAPQVSVQRSRFNRDSSVKLSFNVGDVIPYYVDEVLPGDTFSVRTSKVVRLQTLITPMMDNLYLDFYWFYVPSRLCWIHWQELMGENTAAAWAPTIEYEVPQITAPLGGWAQGTIADYMGIPTGIPGLSVSALPIRAYALIMDQWFRDQNLSDPLNIPIDDANVVGSNGDTDLTDVAKGGMPYKASKYHDYFTSCLPAPQKGADVTIPIGEAGRLPVYAYDDFTPLADMPKSGVSTAPIPMAGYYNLGGVTRVLNMTTESGAPVKHAAYDPAGVLGAGAHFAPANLWAAQDALAQAASINQLRMAYQMQRLLERDARGGTRYIELIRSHFGVTSPDARLQRPEYLGGSRVPININQVVQTSATDNVSPQGTVAAQSLTTDSHSDYTKSFVEHGYVIGLCVARYEHTYQQGLHRMWSRRGRYDYYWPVLAHIGEQAVRNQEIYADGSATDTEVFGYQEAWAEYRYMPNRVAGEMRSSATTPLDVWHLADKYAALPSLSDAWIKESKANVDRVLAVTSAVSNQLFADIFIQCKATRPMPLYGVPGMVDHF